MLPNTRLPDPFMNHEATQAKFSAALDALVEQVKRDRSVLATVLCGSLSHDVVWEKSDIDLVFVTIDDRDAEREGLSLYADGVNAHAHFITRAGFRKAVEGSLRNSFVHSLLAKGRLLYTHDPTIADLCASLTRAAGARDSQVQLLRAATTALFSIAKAHKWFVTRGDLEYASLWILYAATPLAEVEIISAGQLVDREVVPRAMALNAPFFKTIYADLLNSKKTTARVRAALDAVDGYVAERELSLFRPLLEHLAEVGEARSCTELESHFTRSLGVTGITTACEYLADRGLIGKASTPVRLTKKSNVEVEELAFFALGPPSAGAARAHFSP